MNESMSPREERAAAEIRALPEPVPREDFRARLREEFVAGRIPARAARRRADVIPLVVRAGAVLALAAAIAGVFLTIGQDARWHVAEAPASGEVRIDGRAFAAAEVPSWQRELEPGVRLEWSGEAPLRLVLPRRLVLQVMPDAELTLPGPSRDGEPSLTRIERGGVQFATGPRFAGRHLVVHTVAADVEVTGTTFAVLRMPDFTCVCVEDGTVRVLPHGGEPMMLPAGERSVVHDDGRVERFDTIEPAEAPALEALREAAGPLLGGEADH